MSHVLYFQIFFKKMTNKDVDDVLDMIGKSLVTDKESR